MKMMSRLPPTETDEAIAATTVPLDLPDGDVDVDVDVDGDGDGNGDGDDAEEPQETRA